MHRPAIAGVGLSGRPWSISLAKGPKHSPPEAANSKCVPTGVPRYVPGPMHTSARVSAQHRRIAFQQLSHDRLISLTQHFALEVADKRVVENHLTALMRSNDVDFAHVLRLLKCEELQAICDALGLDRSGREKDVLVQRILGPGEATQAELPIGVGRGTDKAADETRTKATKPQSNGGGIVEEGRHDELLAWNGRYARLSRLQLWRERVAAEPRR